MSKKRVLYYVDEKNRNFVWYFTTTLSKAEQQKCFEYIAYLEEAGEEVRRPVGDYLGNKLYELRPKQTRIIYFFFFKDYAVLLHAFRKKSNAISETDIKIATKRMNDFILRYQKGRMQLTWRK